MQRLSPNFCIGCLHTQKGSGLRFFILGALVSLLMKPIQSWHTVVVPAQPLPSGIQGVAEKIRKSILGAEDGIQEVQLQLILLILALLGTRAPTSAAKAAAKAASTKPTPAAS